MASQGHSCLRPEEWAVRGRATCQKSAVTAHKLGSPDGDRRTVAPDRNGSAQSRSGNLLESCASRSAAEIVARCFSGSQKRPLGWLPKGLGGQSRRD